MDDQEKQPFSEVLTELLENEQLPVRHLHRLSDMSEEEWHLFQQRWPDVDVSIQVGY